MRVNKTLLEQMQISDAEIERRMELLGLTSEKLSLLASHKSLIDDHLDDIVDEFHEKQIEVDEIALL